MPSLLDFDELMLKVRSSASQAHIGDAVAAFRAGALRPAIVAAWTAVVFDIMAKVREIELTGDARARELVEQFDAIRLQGDVDRSLSMERTILDVARDQFELLTPHEYADLVRLREDRHRCAHPAMNTAEEAYQPSAELVRYHIASAFTHLLVQAPVQGRAALTRLFAEVSSSLFPTDVAAATRVLRGGPLQRPKEALVRDFVLATVKATLRGERADDDEFGRRALAAVSAAAHLHPTLVDRVFTTDLPRVLSGLEDEDVFRVLRLCVGVPATASRVPESVKTKLENLLDQLAVTNWPQLLLQGLLTPSVAEAAERRARRLEREELEAVFEYDVSVAAGSRTLLDRAVHLLVESPSWNATNALISTVLRPSASRLVDADLESIAQSAFENVEVRNAHGTASLLMAIRDGGNIPMERFLETVFRWNLASKYPQLTEEVAPPLLQVARGTLSQAAVGVYVTHPTYGLGVISAVTGNGDDALVRVDFDDPLFPSRHTLLRSQVRLDVRASG